MDKTIEKYVLLLLNANNANSIRGKLLLQKEMFLLAYEVELEGNLRKLLDFESHNFGPYSYPLEKELKLMEEKGLIKTKQEENTLIYELTEKGEKELNNLTFLSNDLLQRISKLKLGSERLGYKGLLRYVYFNYPDYIDKSKIKKEVLGGN